jgi:CO/xanthine dehydrogenase FAD-binding subunit
VSPALASIETPTSIGDAVTLLGEDVAVIAGGTDLVPMYHAGMVTQNSLVDITRIAELSGVEARDNGLWIGPATTMQAVTKSAHIVGANQALADGAFVVGSRQTRNVATVGGNICRASPSGDTLAPLLACSGSIRVLSASQERLVSADEFFVGPGHSVLRPDEFVVGLTFPSTPGFSAYQRVTSRRWMDLATVGVALNVRTDFDSAQTMVAVSLAVSGAAPTPVLVPVPDDGLVGQPVTEIPKSLPTLIAAAQMAISPIDDVRGTAWYRRRMVDYLVEQVVQTVLIRASSETAG